MYMEAEEMKRKDIEVFRGLLSVHRANFLPILKRTSFPSKGIEHEGVIKEWEKEKV